MNTIHRHTPMRLAAGLLALCLLMAFGTAWAAGNNTTLDPGELRREAGDRLDQFYQAMDELNKELQSQKGEVKREMNRLMDDLADQMKTARKEYDKLQKQGMEAWEKYQPEMERMLDDLEQSLNGTRSRLQEEEQRLNQGGQVEI